MELDDDEKKKKESGKLFTREEDEKVEVNLSTYHR